MGDVNRWGLRFKYESFDLTGKCSFICSIKIKVLTLHVTLADKDFMRIMKIPVMRK